MHRQTFVLDDQAVLVKPRLLNRVQESLRERKSSSKFAMVLYMKARFS